MRKSSGLLSFNTATGFALIENMIAIVLFTVGALGIAASTATAIKVNGDNQARAMALAAATKALEPVYIQALTPGDLQATFATRIKTFVTKAAVLDAQQNVVTPAFDGITVHGNEATGSKDDFTVNIAEAFDSGIGAARKNVLTTAGPYVSPITVAVRVTYAGNAGGSKDLKKAQEYYASFTYVLPKSVVAP